MSRLTAPSNSVPLPAAVLMAVLAACGGDRSTAGQVQGLVSPGGEWIASVPIEGEPGVWVVTIEDSTGGTVFRDSESELCGNLNVYWLWDSHDRLWLWNSDDGRTWICYRFGGEWRIGPWREGCLAELAFGDLEPPDGLVPESLRPAVVQSPEAASDELVLADSGSWFAYRVTLPPVCLEIPALGESLRSSAREDLRRFLDQAAESRQASGVGRPSPPGFLHIAEYSEEPSPAGLVCISMEGYEFLGGAHGSTWHRAFIYDLEAGAFVLPLSLLGDSASRDQFRTAVTDTLERRLGAETSWIEEGTALVPENYGTLLPLPGPDGGIEGFRVVFDPYQVAPYACGAQEVVVRDLGPQSR